MKATVPRQPLDAVPESSGVVEQGKPKQPAWKLYVLLGGVVLLLAGFAGLYFGLKPLAPLGGLFGGGAPSEQDQEFLDNLDQHLADAAAPAGLGIVGLLAGFVMVKVGMSPPKPPTVEELVQREVEARMAKLAPVAPSASSAPSNPPTLPAATAAVVPPQVAPTPVPPAGLPPQAGRACPKCGGRLAAGGRICLSCRATFP